MLDNSIRTILRVAKERLHASSTPEVDAEILLKYALGVSRSILIAWPRRQVDEAQLAKFEALLTRREQGEPIAYIIGHRHFWTVELKTTPAVLIPRPETELIVEWVLDHFSEKLTLDCVDLGTGSGALALAIAKEKPAWRVVATDVSDEALAVAKDNAQFNEVQNVTFYQGAWCGALPDERYDLIVSNPPYIAPGDPHLLVGDVQYEPQMALVAKHYGFEALFHILDQAKDHLKPGGYLLLEHGYDQASAVVKYAEAQGYDLVEIKKDLAGCERMSVFMRYPS